MPAKKRRRGGPGRPPGPYDGAYLPPHKRRRNISVRFPEWILQRLQAKGNIAAYLNELVLKDTKWKEPKE